MNATLAVIGGLIALGSYLSGFGIYHNAENAIHQIYASLLMITGTLGLVIVAVSVGAMTIRAALLSRRP